MTYRDGLTLFGLKAAITTEYTTSQSKLMSSKLKKGLKIQFRDTYLILVPDIPYRVLHTKNFCMEYIQSQRNKIRTKIYNIIFCFPYSVLFQHSLPLNSNYGIPNHVKVCRRRMKMESSARTLSTEYIYILYTDPEIGVEDSNCVTCFLYFPIRIARFISKVILFIF